MSQTKIEWADVSWNPVVGCSACSPGCDHCYAATLAAGRLKNTPQYAGLAARNDDGVAEFTGEVRALPERLEEPLHWSTPKRVFVNSMSDLFHPEVLKMTYEPTGRPYLAELFAVMVAAKRHQFQILTKRPQIMQAVLANAMFRLDVNSMLLQRGVSVMPGGMTDPSFRWPANIWCGTSVEDQRHADLRIKYLLETAAAVRFLSVEPLLGPVDLGPYLRRINDEARAASEYEWSRDRIDWVIVGGESGSRARPMRPDWVESIRDACQQWHVPFLFKQWGEWSPDPPERGPAKHLVAADGRHWPWGEQPEGVVGALMWKTGKKAAGRELDGRTWDEYPA